MRDGTLRQWTVSHSVDVPGNGRGVRREDRCPFRRRQSPQPAHQNASFLVFPNKIIAAVSINNSPMAETFAHLPACSLGRPVPFPAWCREYLEKEFWCLRGAQIQKERPLGESAGEARQVLVSVSFFRHTRVWTTSVPFWGPWGPFLQFSPLPSSRGQVEGFESLCTNADRSSVPVAAYLGPIHIFYFPSTRPAIEPRGGMAFSRPVDPKRQRLWYCVSRARVPWEFAK